MNNRKSLEESRTAGCYCCCKVFDSKEVKSFTDGGKTALCPFCGCDCVLGDSVCLVDEVVLKKANNFWIGGN